MLVPIGLKGSLLSLIERDPDSISETLQRLEMFLRHVRTTCVILTSPDNHWRRLGADLAMLSDQFNGKEHRKAVVQVISKVRRELDRARTRFVASEPLSEITSMPCNCPQFECRLIVNIDNDGFKSRCPECGKESLSLSSWFRDEGFFPVTRYSQLFTQYTWDKERFKKEIWSPLFRYASRVEVFDPHLTWALASKVDGKDYEMPQQYVDGIRWISECFGSLSGNSVNRRSVTFFGEISVLQLKEALGTSARRFHETDALHEAGVLFRNRCNIVEIETQFNLKIDLQINIYERGAPPDGRMRHNRYIATDQAVVAIDRGIPAMQGSQGRERLSVTDVILLSGAIRDVLVSGIPFRSTSANSSN